MANTILTASQVTRESLRVLHQKLNFVGSINRQYDDSFAVAGAKIGDTLKIRLPNRYTVRSGAVMDTQDTAESSVSLQVATQKGVDMNFTAVDLTLAIDDFSDRFVEPAMAVLAAAIEADALSMRQDVWNQVDNHGAAATLGKVLAGRKMLEDNLAPADHRTALLNTQDNVDLVDALKGLFQDSGSISDQYKEGMMGHTVGFDFMETTHFPTQSRGAGDANYAVTTTLAVQGAAAMVVKTGTGAIKKGEVFTIAGVTRVHPETKIDTGVLHQFVATADYVGGAGTLNFSPGVYTTGAFQNVSRFPTANDVIAIQGTISTNYGQSMLYHKDAFTFATADLFLPKGQQFAAREVVDGISMRIWQGADIINDKFPIRIDVLYGYKTLRASQAVRLANN